MDILVVRTIAALIDARLQASTRELAQGVNLCERRLRQRFRAETGVSMRSIMSCGRLHLAAELLVRCALPVKRVQLEAGFLDSANFDHYFKRHFGQSPSQFRADWGSTDAANPGEEMTLCCLGWLCPWRSVTLDTWYSQPPREYPALAKERR